MQTSLRKVLVDSHVAAVTIAILISAAFGETFFALLLALNELFRTLTAPDFPLLRAPAGSSAYLVSDVSINLAHALANVLAARILSRWAFGTGPLETLKTYRNRIMRRPNV